MGKIVIMGTTKYGEKKVKLQNIPSEEIVFWKVYFSDHTEGGRTQEETPKEKTPKEETPKEETPKEKTPKEETPKEETPKEETPKEKTPKEKTPKEETPKEETPKEETPKEEKETPFYVVYISGLTILIYGGMLAFGAIIHDYLKILASAHDVRGPADIEYIILGITYHIIGLIITVVGKIILSSSFVDFYKFFPSLRKKKKP